LVLRVRLVEKGLPQFSLLVIASCIGIGGPHAVSILMFTTL